MTSNNSSTDTDHASLLARIAALELENKLLRESIDKKQPSPGSVNSNHAPDTKIYFDGLRCSRFDADSTAESLAGSLCIPIDESSTSPFDRPKSSLSQSTSVRRSILEQSLTANSNRMLSQSLRDLNLNANVLEDEVCFHLDQSNRFSSLRNDMNGPFDRLYQEGDSKAEEDTVTPNNNNDTTSNNPRKIISASQSMPLDSSSADSERRFTDMNQLTAGTISRAMELQKTIHVLNQLLVRKTKSIGSSAVDGGSSSRRAFSRFYLLSADSRVVTRTSDDWNNERSGRTYLDPIVLRYADCVDRYPAVVDNTLKSTNRHAMSTNELSIFCLLDGLKIRLIPRVVEKLDWMNEVDYKVLVVSNKR